MLGVAHAGDALPGEVVAVEPHDAYGGGSAAGRPWEGVRMPRPVRRLRMLLMLLGGVQAVVGVWLVTDSMAVAAAVWGEEDASAPCCRPEVEERAGQVVCGGLVVLAVAAWGVVTALKFPLRLRRLRVAACAYGWVAVPFALVVYRVEPLLGLAWPVPAVLAVVWARRPECAAWFDRRTAPVP